MTKKIMLINETDDESRVAIVEDSLLQEMLIEHRTVEQTKNNIYKGTVVQLQSSLQAAFVDFGNKKHGFLPSSEINSSIYQRKNLNNNSPIQHKLKKGQAILVQVTREAVDQKGAALTTNISLPGRFMVLMPNTNKGGISKKIEDTEERDRLKSFIAAIDAEKHSAIIRTAGVGRDLVELKKDYTSLKKTWEEILQDFKETKKPGLILEEPDVVIRTLRDYYAEDIEEIWVDNPETFQKALEFLKQAAPRRQKDLKLFVGDRSLFSSYKIERQVEQLTSRDVKLDSGGSIVIDQTEALVAIDVNSGKSNQEGDIDATALRTNLEAAREIARQLRLRNLGGLIVIDFIDMETEKARKKVEEELQDAMSRDKAQRKFNAISQFGLLEMSRQRLAVGISNTIESVCPICNGKGRIPSLLASTNLILRSIRETAAKGNLVQIEGVLPLELANHLLNERRQSITDLELEFGIDIILRGDPEIAVFHESQLKSTFARKQSAAKGDADSRKDSQKGDEDKRKSRQKDKESGKKPDAEKKKEAPDKKKDTVDKKTEPEEKPQKADSEPARPEEKKQDKPKQKRGAEQKKTERKHQEPVAAGDGSIHPSALFTDIQEVDPDELVEITNAFSNRLKGKPDNQPPMVIDQKYLWKNKANQEQVSDKSVTPDDETVVESVTIPEVKPEPVDETVREDGAVQDAAPQAVVDADDVETLREDGSAVEKPPVKPKSPRKPRKQPAKKTGKKPAAKKSAPAKKKQAEKADQKEASAEKEAEVSDSAVADDKKPAKKPGRSTGRGRAKKTTSGKPAEEQSGADEQKDEAGSKKTVEKKGKTRATSAGSRKKAAEKEPAKKNQSRRKPAAEKPSEKRVKAKKTSPKPKKETKPAAES